MARHLLRTFVSTVSVLWLAVPAWAAKPTDPPVTFDIAPAPAWVLPTTTEAAGPPKASNDGVSYLLIDEQEQIHPPASYTHHARQITSDSGLQQGSSISVAFDPSYHKLVFHSIRIVRNGVATDRLDRSQIKLLQREREMESFLYDGSYTAHCHLEDVRVGDVIDYAFTIEGANPVLQGKYFHAALLDWGATVKRSLRRFVYPAKRKLNFAIVNREIDPVISTKDGTTEWFWDERNISPRATEPNMPLGYIPYSLLQVSEFSSWKDVVDWALPLYPTDIATSPALEAEIAKIQAIESVEGRVTRALRFVQDEIRYLGIESGVGSHQPTAPGEVLRRRFGDCKDKTLLLATILRRLGLKATPALVNTTARKRVIERLPSPGVFNHVILQVDTGTSVHWLDATRNYQRGPLSQIPINSFGYALLLRQGSSELTPCEPPEEALPRKEIVEKYRIPAPGGTGSLKVTTEFFGIAAETIRGLFHATSDEELQKHYLQYYARRFPLIQAIQPVTMVELPDETGCRVLEHYSIPEIWQVDEAKTQHVLFLEPTDVVNELGFPGSVNRIHPLALNHPVSTSQRIEVEMFENWKMNPAPRVLSNSFFEHRHEATCIGPKIDLLYTYRSLVDQISPADLPTYDAALRRLKADLGYSFTYQTPAQAVEARKKDPHSGYGEFNWPIATLVGVISLVAIAFSVRFFIKSKRAQPLPPPMTPAGLQGIRGWLLLVALGLLVRPFVAASELRTINPTGGRHGGVAGTHANGRRRLSSPLDARIIVQRDLQHPGNRLFDSPACLVLREASRVATVLHCLLYFHDYRSLLQLFGFKKYSCSRRGTTGGNWTGRCSSTRGRCHLDSVLPGLEASQSHLPLLTVKLALAAREQTGNFTSKVASMSGS